MRSTSSAEPQCCATFHSSQYDMVDRPQTLKCSVCKRVYDPAVDDPTHQCSDFFNLPFDWKCPSCLSPKWKYKILIEGSLPVTWTIQTCCIGIAAIGLLAAGFALKFVLVPLIMAYFVTFLMAPLTDMMEKRPYKLWGPCGKLPKKPSDSELAYQARMLCEGGFEHTKRVALVQTIMQRGPYDAADHKNIQLELINFALMCKLPHAIACLLTLVIFFGGLALTVFLTIRSMTEFGESESADDHDTATMSDNIIALGNKIVEIVIEYGVVITKPEFCLPLDGKISIMQEQDADENWVSNIYVYGMYSVESVEGETKIHGLHSNTSCDVLPVFGSSPGTPLAELLEQATAAMDIFNNLVLIQLLAVFILLERPEGATFGGTRVALEIEHMMKLYINLKTMLSLVIGLMTGLTMWMCQVQLAFVWGLCAFVLNYVPQIGNMVAVVLPVPLIILSEGKWEYQMIAIGLPTLVQLYVVNFLEPELFGQALNLTPLSVLLSLVFFTYAWGIYGAILSVPLLGGFRILMHNSEHPLSETVLRLIRQDADVDIERDLDLDEWLTRMEKEQARLDKVFHIELEEGEEVNPHDKHLLGFNMDVAHTKDHITHTSETRLAEVHAGTGSSSKFPTQYQIDAAIEIQRTARGRIGRRRAAGLAGVLLSAADGEDV